MKEPPNDLAFDLRTLGTQGTVVMTARKLSPLQAARLRAAIASLSEPRRSVYLLCARDQIAYSEIADRLGLTVPEVRRLLADALAELLAGIEFDHNAQSLQ